MANVIKHKRGSGSDPVASDLVVGEVAIRTDVGKLFTKTDSGTVSEIAGGGSDIVLNTLSSSSGTGGGSATFNGSAYRFTLSQPPSVSAYQLLVSINGIIQKPVTGTSQPSEGFAVDGNDIILGDAPATGADYFILTFKSLGVSEPADNTVTNAKVASNAAIAGTKISPDFGSQNVVTTGTLGCGGTFTITNSVPVLAFVDTNDNSDFRFKLNGGTLQLEDTTNGNADRLTIASNGTVGVNGNLDVGAGIDVTGNITVTGTVDGVDVAALSSTVSGLSNTTINNNADNRLITGSGTANTLEGESNLTWTGSSLGLTAGTGNQFPIQIRNDFTPNSQRADYASLLNATSNNTLRLGSVNSNGGVTIQATRGNDSAVKHDLWLQPDGGKVTIGASPIYNFNVRGSGQQTLLVGSTDAGGAYLTLDGDSNGDGMSGDYCSIGHTTAGNLEIVADNPNGDANIIFKAGNAVEALRINGTGHMGLGVTPNANWPSDGDTRAFQIGSGAVVFGRGSGDEDRGGIGVNYYADNVGNKYLSNGQAARVYLNDGNIDFDNTSVANTHGAGAGLTLYTRMRIDSSGNVGIGTTSPERQLHIVGNDGATGATLGNSDTCLVLDNQQGNGAIMEFLSDNDGAGRIMFTDTDASNQGKIQYFHNNDFFQMEVATSSQSTMALHLTKQNAASNVQSDMIAFDVGGSGRGKIVSAHSGSSSPQFSSYSDRRLKTNIKDYTGGYEKIKSLKIRIYDEISNDDTKSIIGDIPAKNVIGYIADEFQEVFPQEVRGTKDEIDSDGKPVYQSISDTFLTPYLVQALQEAVGKIETLETKVAALEAK